jgi:hypothetical protein
VRIVNASSPLFAVSGVLPAPPAAGFWGRLLGTDTCDRHLGRIPGTDTCGRRSGATIGDRHLGHSGRGKRRTFLDLIRKVATDATVLTGLKPGDRHLGWLCRAHLSSQVLSSASLDPGWGTYGQAPRGTKRGQTLGDRHLGTDTWNEERGQTHSYPFPSIQVLEFFDFLPICPRKLLQCRKTLVESGAMSLSCRWDSVASFCCSHACQ